MLISVMGAGCVGSVIASRLYKVEGCSVSLLALGDRAKRLEGNGLLVNNKRYDIPVLKPGETSPDLVVLCVKNYQLKEACEQLKNWISPHSIILPLLNSISPVPIIRQCLPNQTVLYGYISKIDTFRQNGGFVYHIPGDVHFGHAENLSPDPFIEKVATLLKKAGFSVSVDKDMIRGVWRKWMLNVGANQVSALTEADYLQFAAIPEIEDVLRLAMGELLLLAHRADVKLTQTDIDELIEYLTTYPYPKKTSMLQDVQARRKTEIEAISGEIMKLAAEWNQPCPVNEAMYCLIRAKEQVYLQVQEHKTNEG